MMAKKSNVAMRESNDNIDHKSVVINWINIADDVKYFFNSMHKKRQCSNIFVLGRILDHIFGWKKDKLFSPVFVFRRGISNVIYNLVLYLQSQDINISLIYPRTIPFQYLKTLFAIQYFTLLLCGRQFIFLKWDGSIWGLGGIFRPKRIHLFWAFWGLSFKFFFKRGNHGEHP